jgi:hypothetical protein
MSPIGIACSRSGRFRPEALRAPIPPHRRAASAIWQWGFIERLDDGLYYIEVGPEENAIESSLSSRRGPKSRLFRDTGFNDQGD